MQGAGVSTPSAAAVSAATMGLAGSLHIPNGKMFTSGLLSMMLAAGVGHIGRLPTTSKLEGASPPVQRVTAPRHTCCPILRSFQGFQLAAMIADGVDLGRQRSELPEDGAAALAPRHPAQIFGAARGAVDPARVFLRVERLRVELEHLDHVGH